MSEKKSIEVIKYKDGKSVKSIDVSGKSDSTIDRIDSGININLNHEEYYTIIKQPNKHSTQK